MSGLPTETDQFVIVKQIRRELNDRFVRSIILAQDNLARKISRITLVQPLKQGNVKFLLFRER